MHCLTDIILLFDEVDGLVIVFVALHLQLGMIWFEFEFEAPSVF